MDHGRALVSYAYLGWDGNGIIVIVCLPEMIYSVRKHRNIHLSYSAPLTLKKWVSGIFVPIFSRKS